jgi:hypothetical protein
MSETHRRPWRYLLERDIAEVERRLRLYRANTPKRIAEEMGLHINTICVINLGRHPVQARLATEGGVGARVPGRREDRTRAPPQSVVPHQVRSCAQAEPNLVLPDRALASCRS